MSEMDEQARALIIEALTDGPMDYGELRGIGLGVGQLLNVTLDAMVADGTLLPRPSIFAPYELAPLTWSREQLEAIPAKVTELRNRLGLGPTDENHVRELLGLNDPEQQGAYPVMRTDGEVQLGPNWFGIEYKLPKALSERTPGETEQTERMIIKAMQFPVKLGPTQGDQQ